MPSFLSSLSEFFREVRDPAAATGEAQTFVEGSAELFDADFIAQLSGLSLVTRRKQTGGQRGDARSRKKGEGLEFADYRPYVEGDDIRRLDLGVYQRLGKLLVRLHEEEEDLSVHLLIDVSASMRTGDGAKLLFALRMAACIAYVSLARLDRVSLTLLSDRAIERLPPTRGKQQFFKVLRFLNEALALRPEGETNLGQGCRQFLASNPRRGLSVLISDFFDPHGDEEGLNQLRYRRHEITALMVKDERDLVPPRRGAQEIVDVENGQLEKIVASEDYLSEVVRASAEREEKLRVWCRGVGISHVVFSAAESPVDAVLAMVKNGGGLHR